MSKTSWGQHMTGIGTIFGALAALAIETSAGAEIATIKLVKGVAGIERGKTMLPVTSGTRLDVGDVLVTGKDGRIGVTFIDDTRFSVGPRSRVQLTRYEFNETTHKGSFDTRVEKGRLAVISGQIAHENPKGMSVQTPTSVLGVRGTRFVVEVK
jgi:hypothetical protein